MSEPCSHPEILPGGISLVQDKEGELRQSKADLLSRDKPESEEAEASGICRMECQRGRYYKDKVFINLLGGGSP